MKADQVTDEVIEAFKIVLRVTPNDPLRHAIGAAITQWQRENADKFRVFCDSTGSIEAALKAEADAQACPHCGGSGIAAWNVFKPAEE